MNKQRRFEKRQRMQFIHENKLTWNSLNFSQKITPENHPNTHASILKEGKLISKWELIECSKKKSTDDWLEEEFFYRAMYSFLPHLRKQEHVFVYWQKSSPAGSGAFGQTWPQLEWSSSKSYQDLLSYAAAQSLHANRTN